MKKTLLFCILSLLLSPCYAQKTEVRLAVNSGLSTFTGPSVQSESFINYDDANNSGYTNNPYGSANKLTFGISGNIQRVSKNNFIFGIEAGYEKLGSKTSIKRIFGSTGGIPYQLTAEGTTHLNYEYINVNPFMGYRFSLKPVSFDITGGFEIGNILSAKEDGSATDQNGKYYSTSRDRKTIDRDFRPRVQLSANYGRLGINVGYAIGLTNYRSGFTGGTSECYTRILRVGLSCRLTKGGS